ncbi:choline kinase [Aeromicrobium sp. Root344]|uniref:phosphotransferase n=1 Tax=Aeromicrobium sp. Root344 TaxID=1736521 RepID=UPI0006FB598E|nr:phosphotransferase [Aeromicrobium sp. Root344]KQV75244.1 choline kinase [Aeromicrobium sp. Root344]
MVDIEAVLDQVPVLSGSPRTVEELSGGLTNQNLKVTTPTGEYVVRLARSDNTLLGIDREAESYNTKAAEASGAGAPFVDYRPDLGVLVIGYVGGRSYVNADLRTPETIPRVAAAIRMLHSGPRFSTDFDMFVRQPTYLRTCVTRGFAIPDDYVSYGADFLRIQGALGSRPMPTVPCNNDLLAGNIVDDGERIWLIDYDYAGNNDAYFELGNSWTECELDDDHLVELVTAYAGREDPGLVARARLQATVSRYGWSLWGFIQAATSDDDFDFHGWGQERFDKAVADFRSPQFDAWLEAAGA